MESFIAGPCLLGHFGGLRFGFDVPEKIAPVRRWPCFRHLYGLTWCKIQLRLDERVRFIFYQKLYSKPIIRLPCYLFTLRMCHNLISNEFLCMILWFSLLFDKVISPICWLFRRLLRGEWLAGVGRFVHAWKNAQGAAVRAVFAVLAVFAVGFVVARAFFAFVAVFALETCGRGKN